MRGTEIVVSAYPRGIRREGILVGALKPGTIVQIDVSAGVDANGNFTYEAYNADVDGGRPKGPLFILLNDNLQSKDVTDAYTSGDRCFVYTPIEGEEFNLLVMDDTGGTDDTHTAGEMLTPDDGTGKLIASNGTSEIEPFMLLEDIDAPVAADTLAHVIYTGF